MGAKKIVGLVLVAVAVGMVALLIINTGDDSTKQTTQKNDNTIQMDQEQNTENNSLVSQYPHLEGANIGKQVDATGKDEVTVSIDDFIYDETVLIIDQGTTVTWVNKGDIGHNVATDPDSEIQIGTGEILRNNDEFTHSFDETGTFLYLCSPHPTQMRGVVVVL